MLGSTSIPNENAASPLQVETGRAASSQSVTSRLSARLLWTGQAASSWNGTSRQSARFLWTGAGFGVIMLIGVSLALYAPAKPSHLHLSAEVAFMPGMPLFQPGPGYANLKASRPAALPGADQFRERQPQAVNQRTRRQRLSATRMSGTAHKPLSRRAALIAATMPYVVAFTASPVLAYAGEGTMSKEEVMKIASNKLTPFEQDISLKAATEAPFTGKTTNGFLHDNKLEGTYVGAISGAPIFESSAKYDSGTGWPSFYEAVPGSVIERADPADLAIPLATAMGAVRTEIIDAKSGAHLGHVFDDGPKPTGKRYCMNAGAMTFRPKDILGASMTTGAKSPEQMRKEDEERVNMFADDGVMTAMTAIDGGF